MINEKNKIMKAKLKINEFQIVEKQDNFLNNINILYTDILNILNKMPSNLIWECINIFFQYLFLVSFTTDYKVS